MDRDLKYPIKYAILELKENGGWLNNYEDITQGYIVSKCYVMESSIKYFRDGTSKLSYKVVFPFKNNSNLELSLQHLREEPNPSRDLCGECYPVDIVSNLFDSYDEAKVMSIKKNKDLEEKIVLKVYISDPNWKEKYQKLKDEFAKKMDICHEIEKSIFNRTNDMKISRIKAEGVYEKIQDQREPKLVKKLGGKYE